MKILTLELSNGFKRMRANLGSDAEVAKLLELSRAHVGRILKDKINYLEDDTWERIKPLLSQYVSPEALQDKPVSNAEFYRPEKAVKKFPVISAAAAAECNTCYMPIAEYASLNAEGEVSFTEGRDGDIVIRVSGTSMQPWYPEGTLILVRPNACLRNGERVVAVLSDGEVVFKCFAEKGDYFYLLSINENDGKDFKFSKKNYTAVRNIFQVIQSMRDERAVDKAMNDAGIHHFWEKKLREL